jgi:hypothetical protein
MPTAAAWSNTRRHASEHVAPSARTISDVLEPGRDGAGFNANDRILKEAADWLSRQGGQTSIDQLAPRVERTMKAY